MTPQEWILFARLFLTETGGLKDKCKADYEPGVRVFTRKKLADKFGGDPWGGFVDPVEYKKVRCTAFPWDPEAWQSNRVSLEYLGKDDRPPEQK